MGRQFGFIATIQEQADMCKIFTDAGAIPTDGKNAEILDLDSTLNNDDDSSRLFYFALPQSYLKISEIPVPTVPFETAPRGPIIDSVTGFATSRYVPSSSDLIEFLKCQHKENVPIVGEIISRGRIWYPTTYKTWFGNNEEIIRKLFNKVKYYVKKNFIYSKIDTCYIGPDAYDKWKKGEVFLSNTHGLSGEHIEGFNEDIRKRWSIRYNPID